MKTKNRILTATNYTYLEPKNFQRAKAKGAIWGSASNYINFLIAQDHKDKASMKASKDLQAEFFTPVLARAPKDRKEEYAKTKKAKKGKKKSAGKLLKAAKKSSRKSSKRTSPKASKKKSAKSGSARSSRPMKKAAPAASASAVA